jgi:hypothetical protein
VKIPSLRGLGLVPLEGWIVVDQGKTYDDGMERKPSDRYVLRIVGEGEHPHYVASFYGGEQVGGLYGTLHEAVEACESLAACLEISES